MHELSNASLEGYAEQPSRGVLRKIYSENIQSNFIELTLQHGRSPVNLLHIFRTPFPKNTSGGLLLTRVRLIGKIDQNDTIL